jgi:hypothetical protein
VIMRSNGTAKGRRRYMVININGEPEMASCKRYEDGIRVRSRAELDPRN